MLAVVPAGAQQARAPLCDAVAARLKTAAAESVKEEPLAQLIRGNDPVITLAGNAVMTLDGLTDEQTAALQQFQTRFKPTAPLISALTELLGGYDHADVKSVPDGRLHAVEVVGGSAACQGFVFFQTHADSESTMLPDPVP